MNISFWIEWTHNYNRTKYLYVYSDEPIKCNINIKWNISNINNSIYVINWNIPKYWIYVIDKKNFQETDIKFVTLNCIYQTSSNNLEKISIKLKVNWWLINLLSAPSYIFIFKRPSLKDFIYIIKNYKDWNTSFSLATNDKTTIIWVIWNYDKNWSLVSSEYVTKTNKSIIYHKVLKEWSW